MALYVTKYPRLATLLTLPREAIYAGCSWTDSLKVWDSSGTLIPTATLDDYTWRAIVREFGAAEDDEIATGTVTWPSAGTVQWAFVDADFEDLDADTYRFTLDVTVSGSTQRLIDARLPIRAE
jgi:hypothetical protein